ncbi:Transforming growth factor beta receptor type 3 [Merluccius polli]|uniref:Transforming growth factor beta receptor type 3 n=1 Tax=Merluccius polli TaxID=89951 RepID=A0AA47MA64_MERPO|nr:Transforming growth factor beta receptor type 3 [Merluccius polli]
MCKVFFCCEVDVMKPPHAYLEEGEFQLEVSPGSEVRFQTKNFSLGCQVIQETLPHGNEHLLAWGLKKYRGLTSFLELRMTRDIYINVGEDRVFPESCRIDNKFLSLNYLGAYVQPQPSRGCILSGPDHGPAVHIIELQAPNSSSAFQVDVIVELQPIEGQALLQRDVVLVLKCSKSVNWVIKSRDIIGKLEVLSSDTVALSSTTERQMQVSKLPRQLLPSGSQALIKWAEQRGYRPVSFTGTAVANLFTLRLRELGILDPVDSMFPTELAVFHDMGAADRRSVLPFPNAGAGPGVPFLPPPFHTAWEDGQPQEQQGALSAGLEVHCEETRMVVSVDKESLQASGFANANLTLQDPECKATVNATHYTLETPLSGCETTVYPMLPSSSVLYINSILISTAEVKDGSGRPQQSFLEPTDPPPSIMVQPTDLPPSIMVQPPETPPPSIIFNCTYGVGETSDPVPRIVPGPGGREEEEVLVFIMDIYHTVLFRSPDPQRFHTVLDGQQVFVEVLASRMDPELGFMVRSCFVSPNSNPKEPSQYRLVENLCPTDDSVRFYPSMEDRQRFSFAFESQFNVSLLFLHCEMSLCTKNQHSSRGLPTCIPASKACEEVTLDNIMSMMMNSKTSTKPLVVIPDKGPIDPPEGPLSTPLVSRGPPALTAPGRAPESCDLTPEPEEAPRGVARGALAVLKEHEIHLYLLLSVTNVQ